MGFDVTATTFRSEAFARGARMLRTALGATTASYLEDPSIVEVMLNPDGRLWIDRLSGGLEDTGCRVTPADAERIVRLVAHHVGVEVHAGSPARLGRVAGKRGTVRGSGPARGVPAPCFAIRRPAVAVFTLGDYVDAGIMSAASGRAASNSWCPSNGKTFSSPAAPRLARPLWSMRCSPKSPRPATAWC